MLSYVPPPPILHFLLCLSHPLADTRKTFLALLTALSLPPTLLFATFALSTLLFSLGAAALFALFWTGVALLLLVPSLFVAAGCAVFLWAWAVGSFVVVRWVAGRMGVELGFGESKGRQGTAPGLDGKAMLDGKVGGFGRGVDGKLDGKLERFGREVEKEVDEVEAEL